MQLKNFIFVSFLIFSLGYTASCWGMDHKTTGTAKSFNLDEFLTQVQKSSPDLEIENAASNEAASKARGIRLPPPMLGLMLMNDGSGRNQGLEFSQEIPFPSKIFKEKEIRSLDADSQKAGAAYRKQFVIHQARVAYLQYWSAFEKQKIILQKLEWLKSHARISKSTSRSDSSAQIHLLGVESEVDRAENEAEEVQSLVIEKSAALNLFVPDLKTDGLEPLLPPLEKQKIQKHWPLSQKTSAVLWKESEAKSAQLMRDLKKQAYLPDFFVRYRAYNGNDQSSKSSELMLGITLPFLYFWQPQAEVSELEARNLKAQSQLRQAEAESSSKLQSLNSRIESLSRQLQNLKDKLLPRAHRRMKLVENLSARTMEALNDHRSVMLDYLELQFKAIELRMDLETSQSEFMALTEKGSSS